MVFKQVFYEKYTKLGHHECYVLYGYPCSDKVCNFCKRTVHTNDCLVHNGIVTWCMKCNDLHHSSIVADGPIGFYLKCVKEISELHKKRTRLERLARIGEQYV